MIRRSTRPPLGSPSACQSVRQGWLCGQLLALRLRQASLPVVDNNRKVVGALSVVGEKFSKNLANNFAELNFSEIFEQKISKNLALLKSCILGKIHFSFFVFLFLLRNIDNLLCQPEKQRELELLLLDS